MTSVFLRVTYVRISHLNVCIPHFGSEAVINTRILRLYLLIVTAWRRAVLCALAEAALSSPVSPEDHPDPQNTCEACTDILDTSSWDIGSFWVWEQAFFNKFALGMSLTEYGETANRKTGIGPYTVHYDGWGSMAVQTTGNAGTWQMLQCDAVGMLVSGAVSTLYSG